MLVPQNSSGSSGWWVSKHAEFPQRGLFLHLPAQGGAGMTEKRKDPRRSLCPRRRVQGHWVRKIKSDIFQGRL